MTIRLSSFLLPLLLGSILLPSARASIKPTALETMVIQEGGRRKPYLVFAEETLRSLSGKTRLTQDGGRMDAMEIITSIWMDPSSDWKGRELILVSNRPLKQQLGLETGRKLFSWNELAGNAELGREIAEAAETRRRDPRAKLVGLQKEASDVGLRMGLLESLLAGGSFRVIPPLSGTDWQAPSGDEMPLKALRNAWSENSLQRFEIGRAHV